MEQGIDILTETGETFCKLIDASGKRILHIKGKQVRFDTLAAQVYASEAARLKAARTRKGKTRESSSA